MAVHFRTGGSSSSLCSRNHLSSCSLMLQIATHNNLSHSLIFSGYENFCPHKGSANSLDRDAEGQLLSCSHRRAESCPIEAGEEHIISSMMKDRPVGYKLRCELKEQDSRDHRPPGKVAREEL